MIMLTDTAQLSGAEAEFGPGQVSFLPPGHDAWVVGDQAVEIIDISGSFNCR